MTKNTVEKKKDASLSVRETVRNMQVHYAQTGVYRAADLNHVLGDPKTSIGLTVPLYYSFSARTEK